MRLLTLALGVIYTWILILSFAKEKESDIQKKEYSNLISSTITLLVNSMQHELISVCIKCILASITNGIGRFNATKNLPFLSSMIIQTGDQEDSYEACNKFILKVY